MQYILGLHIGHDSAAALIKDGRIIADVAEERFTRVKNDCSFPLRAIEFCLQYAGIEMQDLDAVALPSKYLNPEIPIFFDVCRKRLPRENRTLKSRIKQSVLTNVLREKRTNVTLPIYQKPFQVSDRCNFINVPHHKAHAASAYYTSGLNEDKTLVVTMDGVGDNVSATIWKGQNNRLEKLQEWGSSASLGYFYSNCTEALGWRHGSDEWKTMGLAPYGTPKPGILDGFYPVFRDGKLVKPHEFKNGGRWCDHSSYHYHFDEASELKKIADAVGAEDFSAEAQRIFLKQSTEIIVPWLKKLDTRKLCAAGGSFLNVKANQDIWYKGVLDFQWIYPNPGDGGLAAGAALTAYFENESSARHELLDNAYLGPEYSNQTIQKLLDERGIDYQYLDNPSAEAARCLADNMILGWFQGRVESGPRALGNRSILMSPLRNENKDIINRCVKYREAFRPFCPSMLMEKSDEYLLNARDERFMVTSFMVKGEKKDKIPAVVHVDGTARPQMVRRESNPRYYDLIKAFGDITGEYVVLNTSFNVKGEPIVTHPRDALRCFYDTGLDVLILGNYKISKPKIPDTNA